jgi:hypothetical protein
MNYCAVGKAKVGFVRINHPAHQPGRWTDCGAACELRKTVNLKHTHQAIEDDLTRSSTKCTMTVGARETIGRVSPDTGLDQIAGRDG